MRLTFNSYLYLSFILILAILCYLSVYAFNKNTQVLETNLKISESYDLLFNLEKTLALVTELETDQRGYVITGNEEFYRPAFETEIRLLKQINNLEDNPIIKSTYFREVDTINNLIIDKISFIKETVSLRKEIGFEASRENIADMEGKVIMDKIRTIITNIQSQETKKIENNSTKNKNNIDSFNLTFSVLVITVTLILTTGVTIIIRNWNLRLQSEKKLKKSSQEIEDLYNNAPCGYHSLDHNGTYVNINETELQWLGYKREELIGKVKFTDLLTNDSLVTFRENFESFKNKGFVQNLEFNLKRKDGSEIPVILNAKAIFDENGKYIKSRSTVFDNTLRKEAEVKIHSLNKELEAFTYTVSHDLRAPLRSINGYTKILTEDYYEKIDEEGKKTMKIIMRNAEKMGSLIDNLLQFSRLGRSEINKNYSNMQAIVESVISEINNSNNQLSQNIIIDKLLPSPFDRNLMIQVWQNLISNAIKYSSKKSDSRIQIGSYEDELHIIYFIKDNGVGFNMEYKDKLFGVFQRLHKMNEFEGTGVGLAIVERIITKHDGQIWAEAQVNKGATFSFSLPKKV
ncbi:MAG: ATP-binding protein [Cytophagaceae bacterium]